MIATSDHGPAAYLCIFQAQLARGCPTECITAWPLSVFTRAHHTGQARGVHEIWSGGAQLVHSQGYVLMRALWPAVRCFLADTRRDEHLIIRKPLHSQIHLLSSFLPS